MAFSITLVPEEMEHCHQHQTWSVEKLTTIGSDFSCIASPGAVLLTMRGQHLGAELLVKQLQAHPKTFSNPQRALSAQLLDCWWLCTNPLTQPSCTAGLRLLVVVSSTSQNTKKFSYFLSGRR